MGGFLREAASIAVDAYGNVYVADIWQSLLLKFDPDGALITAWAFPAGNIDPDAFRPTCLAVDSSGNVYMTDYLNNQVLKFDPLGKLIVSYGSEGSDEGYFSYPNGIAVDSEDNVYVVDTLNSRIQKFDDNGTFVSAWGIEGTWGTEGTCGSSGICGSQDNAYGEMNYPFSIAIDSDDNLFVTDTFNHRVQKFSTSGLLEPKCLIAAVLGADNRRLDTIRRFRDEVLAKTSSGRKLIEMYYQNSNKMTKIIKDKPTAKKAAETALKLSLPLMDLLLNTQ